MFTPPVDVGAVLAAFAPLFTEPSWLRVQVLLCGALLAPANHTLTAALRALGLAGEPGFQNYHRLLNRARWSARQVAQVLLELLVEAFVPAGPVILGLDDTIERRRGRKLTARAIYYDAARSSKACFQKRERPALDECSRAGTGALGRPGLGLTVPDRPVPFGTLHPVRAPGPAAQAALSSVPGDSSAKCAGGCPSGRSSWCPTPVMPRWSCWRGAPDRPDRSL